MADSITLGNKNYPIRFDFRGVKEFKTITGDDILSKFNPGDTDHMITLTYVGLKSGFFFENPNKEDFLVTIEDVSKLVALGDMKKVVEAFTREIHGIPKTSGGEQPGEIHGTA